VTQSEIDDLIWFLARGSELNCEGHEYCSFCLEVVDSNGHSDDCPMIRARQILGDKWDKYEEENPPLTREEIAELVFLQNKFSVCFYCGKRMRNKDMKFHQETDPECIEAQKKRRTR
jgi:hypothetical protein